MEVTTRTGDKTDQIGTMDPHPFGARDNLTIHQPIIQDLKCLEKLAIPGHILNYGLSVLQSITSKKGKEKYQILPPVSLYKLLHHRER